MREEQPATASRTQVKTTDQSQGKLMSRAGEETASQALEDLDKKNGKPVHH